LVDERGGPAAVARLARLGPFPKVVDRVGQCDAEPSVVKRVNPEVAGRLSSALVSPERKISARAG
jgi:hypothetical protein